MHRGGPGGQETPDNGFDSMNRLQNIVESNPAKPSLPTTLVSNMAYGAAGEVTLLTEGTTVETREYNAVGQMTRILASQSASTTMDLRYDFAAGANNGIKVGHQCGGRLR
jgi:hypothetical protein